MNKEKREILHSAISLIDSAINKVRSVEFSEQDSMDNMPENLQYSDRYESMENAVAALENAEQSLEDARDNILDAINV